MNGPYRKSTAAWISVRLEDASGAGVTGVVYNSGLLSLLIAKNGGAGAAKTLAAQDWVEVGHGEYWVQLSTTDTNTIGPALLVVVYDGVSFAYPFHVHTADLDDVMRAALGMYVVIGAPTYNNGTPDLASVRVRLYDSQAHANADDGVTGLIVEFTRTVSYGATALSGSAHQISGVVGA